MAWQDIPITENHIKQLIDNLYSVKDEFIGGSTKQSEMSGCKR